MSGDEKPVRVAVELLESFAGTDLEDLCEATEAAITDGGGFGWITPPRRDILEKYWQGVMLVPGRSLLVGRID
ncbi:MAG: family N-acetyltransferase, partial [Rhodospirillales bacterium]|nr:family N-acetyltransferase [Rhodospirillales bacterium]